jgi:hypothetical protein
METKLFCEGFFGKKNARNKKNKELFIKLLRIKYGDFYADRCVFDNLKENLRSRCYCAFKKIKENKPYKTEKILGADFLTVKNHLESLFTEEMNWYNMGRYGWHIDHIKPLALANNKEELIELCHYTNLQPLWWKDNMSKGSDYNGVRITYKNREQWKIK